MLSLWNVSRCIEEASWFYGMFYTPIETWRPPDKETIDWNGGIEWSVPVAAPGIIGCISDGVVVTTSGTGDFGVPGGAQTGWRVDVGYDAMTGAVKWGPINRTLTPWAMIDIHGYAGEGVYIERNRNDLTITAYELQTGQKRWTTVPEDNIWGYYDYYHGVVIGYGKAYSFGIGGAVYCYDVETGDRLWKWDAGEAGLDTPYGVWPLGTWGDHHILADGKLYVMSGQDYTPPVYKGAKLYCIDAETGDEIWSTLSYIVIGSTVLHDGYMIWKNGYDNQLYCYSKGPSKTTVEANPSVQMQGSSVLIQGMVTDISPGTKTNLLTSRFPNGVPAVSDSSQSAFMEYLYQQQPKPTDTVGVEVFLKILDPNGEWYSATVTVDKNGVFSHSWAPAIVGDYHVTAMFEGSKSYYKSEATTTFTVDQAPVPSYQGPSADDIAAATAQRTINMLPAYPDVPTASEVAQETVNQLPAYPEMPESPEIPAYLTIDLVIIAAVAIAIIIGLYAIIKKQK